ncbi:MAG: hypothetical protein NTY35_16315 [Planctomycetota bacterium]|nr:hypothetical protein [Planctomycetota bacterium]
MRNLHLLGLTLLATAGPVLARGQVTVFQGAPGQPGAVLAYDESSGALVASPAELGAAELLPIEAAGRTALEEFLPGKPRRIEDVGGASRLALPDQQGSLYHYARGPAGARVFGYFVVTRAGMPRVLVERAGIGAGTAQDPFLDRVAVAPDGRALLCATRAEAGGDLLEVRFGADPIEVVDRTAGAPPLRLSARGLALTATHAWALSGRGLLRCARTPTATTQLVSFGTEPAPTHFQGDLVTSARGTAVAFHAGASALLLHAWTVTNDGIARRASTAAGPHASAGLSPQSVDGPYLAVSDDGTWCAWRTDGVPSHECLVARAAAPVGELPEVLSSDARFLDTLDEVAVFFFRGPTQLLFAVGEQGVPTAAGIEGVDVFRATLAPGTPPPIENMTGSSGDLTLPFTAVPQLKPTRWVLTPDRRSLLLYDEQGSSGRVLAVDTATGSLVDLIPAVKSFDWIELCGRRFAFGLQRSSGAKLHEVHSILADLTGAPALSYASPETEPTRAVTSRADGWVAWLRSVAGGSVLQRARVPSASVETLGPPGLFESGQGWTPGDAQAFGTAGSAWVWPVGGGAAHAWPIAGPFQILPGA